MYFVGPHVSIAGGVHQAPLHASTLGATGFGLFVKNQRQWRAAELTDEHRSGFGANMQVYRFKPEQVLPHAGYLINLANPAPDAHAKALESFIGELQRCADLGLTMLNLHPGSHLRQSTAEAGVARIAESINEALRQTQGVTVVLENTAGQGGSLGRRFEELAGMIEQVTDKQRVGICLDTCHLLAAGYELRSRTGFDETLDAFERTVGFKFLRGLHLNDAKTGLNSHVDRHESLGRGELGWDVFEWIMTDRRFENMPLVIETPDEELWKDEVARLLSMAGQIRSPIGGEDRVRGPADTPPPTPWPKKRVL